MWLPAIIILLVTLFGICFAATFLAIKWLGQNFLSMPSDPARSPYSFFFATLGIMVLVTKLVVEISKQLWPMAAIASSP